MNGRILIIAGSDSGGGAGIQADIKTVTALGGYAATAITALTAQNTQGIFAVQPVTPHFIAEQARRVLSDIGADCIKIGMLHSVAVIETVADVLEELAGGIPLLLDPVMIAKDGTPLLDQAAIKTLKRRLLPRASLITPNLPEAEALTGLKIGHPEAMPEAANALLELGSSAVLLKGGHLPGHHLYDLLMMRDYKEIFQTQRISTPHTHGTGCTLASAVATGLAQKRLLLDAVRRAHAYVQEAIRTAPGYGQGQGPLNHTHTVSPLEA
ncbi:bifunctional hydroxymethylpyrimidine kinase/phosphomethylpyrimidine kinase [Nitrosococcus wardiae]|uniref:hydroxymethylpyrimidine kinase n=1 Tax=Nitrosococcus wardiae TaxID=1814290 RepID=A0A4V1AW99_9GAMM|nr:bifunctional hydroxymethylpyrimidine kinase/phosphomethylpyrimidine kinase [Nitrosococcus wardiae]QBQ55895.1 bifunctional hydroxymethylpyrimidine kinase/phosphomethylpyrimidine kinase [Nitrosococcus wardiae]